MTQLRTAIVAAGLLRAAEAMGGNGAVLAKGDPDIGALMLVLTSKGVHSRLFERVSSPAHGFTWNNHDSRDSLDPERVARLIDSKKRFDGDVWVIELDIPQVEQFIADVLGAS